MDTRLKNAANVTNSGIHKTLLLSFLRLCEVQDSIVPLVDSSVVKVIPVAFQKDEMAE